MSGNSPKQLEARPRNAQRSIKLGDACSAPTPTDGVAGSFEHWVTSYVFAEIADEGRGALKKGRNVLAVHCHQTDGGQGIDVGLVLVRQASE